MDTQTQFRTIASIELVKSNSRHNFPLHSHRVFCAGVVTDGHLVFQLGGRNFILQQHDLYFIPAGVAHTILNYQGLPYRHMVICIQENRLWQVPAAGVLRDTTSGKALLSLIQDAMESGAEDDVLQFINELSSSYLKTIDKEKETFLLQEVLAFIQLHIDESFSLDALCAAMSMSKYYLIRLVKAQGGLTPHQLYIQEKIRAVRSGILQAGSLTELAHRYHFSDQSHLCHVFKSFTGITPKQYMQSVGKY